MVKHSSLLDVIEMGVLSAKRTRFPVGKTFLSQRIFRKKNVARFHGDSHMVYAL